jgi:hypothetical protein
MLTHPTLDQLNQLGLHGMAKAFGAMSANGEAQALSHAEWLGLILDHEMTWRQDKRMAARLRHACGATIWVRSASIRMRTDCRGATGMACLFVAGKIYVSA